MVKTAIAVAAATALLLLALPLLILTMAMPGQGAQQFFNTCTAALGIRGAVVANPPPIAPTAAEVLLKIDQTATTLGFGRQGATVTAAIAIHATGLANAANRTNSETQRYAHSTLLTTGAGALGLPLSWATPAELMTPEVSTALALDRMVDTEPRWRDTEPANLAAQITGLPANVFTQPVAQAQERLAALATSAQKLTTPTSPAMLTTSASATAARSSEVAPPAHTASPTTTPVIDSTQASSAAATAPAAANCLHALSTALPEPAPGDNPAGPAIAAAAQHAIRADQTTTTPAAPNDDQHPNPPTAGNSAEFVATILSTTLNTTYPTTIAEQLRHRYLVLTDPQPGDVVYTDISADQGPHLAGIAVANDTMITVLPGHHHPESTRIGPNRVIRRIQRGLT